MREIVQDGDPVLRKEAQEVPEELFGTPELKAILTDMGEALDSQKDGVALAAPQIGISYRIFIVRYDRTLPPPAESLPPHEPSIGIFINPEFIKASRKREEMDEGCLSVRGVYGKTARHAQATVEARTFEGGTFQRGGGGLLAQIFQHETDHLNGILFTDHAISTMQVQPHD
ncbi:peptide deformylase [Patescibacteria group bacterium]|nr:peptide deformylase [Patescibacteria group bacterium]MBU1754710.1 peptide deformylase [Patescibacteria group bacterium]